MGMPRLRQAYTPHPVVDQSAAHLRAYIEGNDAVSGRPFMQEVLEGLTSPLEDADLQGLSFERTTPRLVEPDSEDSLQRLFEENRWTDMLPIIAADGGARRGDAQGDQPSAGRDRRTASPDRVSRGLGIHRGESGGQCRDGGCAARVPPGHPRVGRQRNDRTLEQHDVIRHDSRSSTARSAARSR